MQIVEMVNETAGDITMASVVLTMESLLMTSPPPMPSPAPTRQPMSAWDEELGMPYFQVMRFQKIAPTSAVRVTLIPVGKVGVTIGRESIFTVLEIVFDTRFRPRAAGKKLNIAEITTAWTGVSDLLAMVVAVALAVS